MQTEWNWYVRIDRQKVDWDVFAVYTMNDLPPILVSMTHYHIRDICKHAFTGLSNGAKWKELFFATRGRLLLHTTNTVQSTFHNVTEYVQFIQLNFTFDFFVIKI